MDSGDMGKGHTLIRHAFGADHCFLCGVELSPGSRTREHVIPLWAQNRFELGNAIMNLTNGTGIAYRQLTVPCCEDCNRNHLQPLETAMAEATKSGVDAVRSLGREKIFLWLGKVFYGLLSKDHQLPWRRDHPQAGPIVDEREIAAYDMHNVFLQMARGRAICEGFFPASIMVVETQCPKGPGLQWDLRDDVDSMFIAVRMGSTGLLAVLHDSGVQEEANREFIESLPQPLHPIQFLELAAFVGYGSRLFTRTPKYVLIMGDPIRVVQMPLGGFSMKPLLGPWVHGDYARYLSFHTEIPMDHLYEAPDKLMSWIRRPDGGRRRMSLDEFPWPLGR